MGLHRNRQPQPPRRAAMPGPGKHDFGLLHPPLRQTLQTIEEEG